MKNYILLAIAAFTFTSCISVKINNEEGLNKVYANHKNSNISAKGTYFENGIVDSDWSNENSSNATKAKFKKANGVSYIKLNTKKKVEVEFHHQVKVEGNIKFEIVDATKNVVFQRDLSQNSDENFELKLNEGEYTIRWDAKNANGSYFLEWKEK